MSAKKRSILTWLKLFLVIIALSAIAVGAIYLMWYSPVFKIQKVDARGDAMTEEEMSQFLGPDVIGVNIIFWEPDLSKVADSRFESVDIKKSYFSRTIEIIAKEREKNLIWCFTSAGNCFWVAKTGLIFSSAPSSSGDLITMVEDMREVPLDAGAHVLPPGMMFNLNLILTIIHRLDLPAEYIRIEDIKLRELIVKAANGPKIIFSLSIDPDFTETAISELIKTDSWRKIKTLNLTVSGRAYPGY